MPQAQPSVAPFFIGTYTSRDGSKGVYEGELDLRTGKLAAPVLMANAINPSFLAVSRNGKNLYAVNESQDDGSVMAYSIKRGKLLFLNSQPIKGSSPCYLSVDPSDKNVFVASYGGGAVSCFPLAADGELQQVSGIVIDSGVGPDRSRQEAPHMHWVQADTSGRFIYTCDLGTDKVQAHPFDSLTGRISPSLQPDLKVPPGSGPRHGAWGPHGKYLYVANEMGSSVSVLKVDQSSGRLELLQTVSSVEKKAEVAHNTAAEIECDPSARRIYVSNRGDDSVAVFRILPSGGVQRIQVKHLDVRVPRGFAIDPTGKWLIAAGQESNDLESLPIERSGKLGEVTGKTALSKPTCVVFCR